MKLIVFLLVVSFKTCTSGVVPSYEQLLEKFADMEETQRLQDLQAQALQEETKELKANLHHQQQKLNTLYDSVSQTSDAQLAVKQIHTRQMVGDAAFTVSLGRDLDLGDDQLIIFDHILTNDGYGYNAGTGIFTAPHSGLYLFHFSILERDSNQLWAALVINNRDVLDATVETVHNSMDAQSGNLGVFRIYAGDKVWVRSRECHSCTGGHFHVEGSSGTKGTTFTGIYLSP